MSKKVDLYSNYGQFEADVNARVRKKTFGEEIGQNSWTTDDEYRRWAKALGLSRSSTVLEVASGSGGPALFMAQHLQRFFDMVHRVSSERRLSRFAYLLQKGSPE